MKIKTAARFPHCVSIVFACLSLSSSITVSAEHANLKIGLLTTLDSKLSDFEANAISNNDYQLALATDFQWRRVLGSARDIGVGNDGSVWVVGTDRRGGGYGIYHWNGSDWNRVEGGATRIDVDPQGNPWIINSSDDIFRYVAGNWQRMPGSAKDIGVGADGSVWVVSSGGVFYWNTESWEGVGGSGVRVDVDKNGSPWVIGRSNDIFQFVAGTWERRPGEARDIGIGGDDSVWVAGTRGRSGTNRIYRWTDGDWNAVDGNAMEISVDAEGFPWIVNRSGNIYTSH